MVEGRDDLSRQNQNQDDETARNLAADGARTRKQDDPLAGAWNSLNNVIGDVRNQALDGMVGNDSTKKIVDAITPEVARQYQSGKSVQDRVASGKVQESDLSREDRANLNAFREVNSSVSKLPFYDQSALMKHVEDGIARKAAQPVQESRAAQKVEQVRPDGGGSTSRLPAGNTGRVEPQPRDDRAVQRLTHQAAKKGDDTPVSRQADSQTPKFSTGSPLTPGADAARLMSPQADRQTSSRADVSRTDGTGTDGFSDGKRAGTGFDRPRIDSNRSDMRGTVDIGSNGNASEINSRYGSPRESNVRESNLPDANLRNGNLPDGTVREGTVRDTGARRDKNLEDSGFLDSNLVRGTNAPDMKSGIGANGRSGSDLEKTPPVRRADTDEAATKKAASKDVQAGKGGGEGEEIASGKGAASKDAMAKSRDALVQFGDLQLDGKAGPALPRLQSKDSGPNRTREFVIFDPGTLKPVDAELERTYTRTTSDRPPTPKVIPDENPVRNISWRRSLLTDSGTVRGGMATGDWQGKSARMQILPGGTAEGQPGMQGRVDGARQGRVDGGHQGRVDGAQQQGRVDGVRQGRVDVNAASIKGPQGQILDASGKPIARLDGRTFRCPTQQIIDKRYITGTEIALAAIIAAAGARRIQHDRGSGTTAHGPRIEGARIDIPGARGDVPGTRVDIPGARVDVPGARVDIPGARVDVAGARIEAPNARNDSNRGFRPGDMRSFTCSQRVDKRYITGTEIALAAIIASAGVRRSRANDSMRSTEATIAARQGVAIIRRTLEPSFVAESKVTTIPITRDVTTSGARPKSEDFQNSKELSEADDQADDISTEANPDPPVVRTLQDVLDETSRASRPGETATGKTEADRRKLDIANDEASSSGDLRYPAILRPTTLIGLNDTLVTIAEAFFLDSIVAWLIADLNRDCSKQSYIDGKRVCEFRNRQVIVLPVAEDIELFYAHRAKDAVPENLVTIVEQTQIDIELLTEHFSPVVGRGPQRVEIARKSPDQVPGKPSIPGLSSGLMSRSASSKNASEVTTDLTDLTLTGREAQTLATPLDYFVPRLPDHMVEAFQLGAKRILRRTSELKRSALKRFMK